MNSELVPVHVFNLGLNLSPNIEQVVNVCQVLREMPPAMLNQVTFAGPEKIAYDIFTWLFEEGEKPEYLRHWDLESLNK